MPYQLNDNEIKLILPLFDNLESQAMTLTSQQQLLNLRIKLSQAFSSDVSGNLTISDDLNHQTDDSAVSNEYCILHSKMNSNFP
jgi:hypothetical protein